MYICQICKKAPATIHLTDIHNNVKKEIHFCESCAAEKGFNLQGAANLPQLLGLAAKKSGSGAQSAAAAQTKAADSELICLHCGSTWAHFSERGRLGCPHDYRAFGARLRQLIANQIAPGSKDRPAFHIGKRPGGARPAGDAAQMIIGLEKKIRAAVAEENYEAAARFKGELDRLREGKAQ